MTIPVDYLVVAGGGAGGYSSTGNSYSGAGGGGGGMLTGTGVAVPGGTALTVTVGAGGTASTSVANSGGNSVFSSFTAVGGGFGAPGTLAAQNGGSGGSGGGSTNGGTAGTGTGGQGTSGGAGAVTYGAAGSGGGVTVAGQPDTSGSGVNGGTGGNSSISGSSVTYGGGGASGSYGLTTGATGGAGGGGNSGGYVSTVKIAGSAGTDGRGGGGGGAGSASASAGASGGRGGNGIVIVRYSDTYAAATGVTGSPSIVVSGGWRTYTWTTTGTWSITIPDGGEPISEAVTTGFAIEVTGPYRDTHDVAVTTGFTLGTTGPYHEAHDASVTAGSALLVAHNIPVEYLVVAGGGGGGSGAGGGGGAGGVLTGTLETRTGVLNLTVGAGGINDVNGSDSTFSSFTATGGGRGVGDSAVGNGGSGGGGSYLDSSGGTGVAGQGYAGGDGTSPFTGTSGRFPYGGGGGAGAAGGNGNNNNVGGNGGDGIPSSISGALTYYGGGGGGRGSGSGITGGTGGLGGGGDSGVGAANGEPGTPGTGGGGGAAGSGITDGGEGGSGIVILRYPDTFDAASATTGSPSIFVSGGYRIYTWTAIGAGSITLGGAFNELHSAATTVDVSVGQSAVFNNSISESVTLGSIAQEGWTTFDEPYTAAVVLGFGLSDGEYDPRTRLQLKFNEANGTTTVADTSAYQRTASFSAGSVTDTQGVFTSNSAALGNPGGTATISQVSVASPEDIFTFGEKPRQFDLWFRMWGFPITQGTQPLIDITFANGDTLKLQTGTSSVSAYYDGSVTAHASAAYSYAANTWKHYRLTLDGNTMRVGYDGTELCSVTLGSNIWTGGVTNTPTNVRFGSNGTNFAQGYLDSVEFIEGGTIWTGGAYTVPVREPTSAAYHAIDAWTDEGAMQVVPWATFASSVAYGNIPVTESVTPGFYLAATGGAVTEPLSFGVVVGARFSTSGVFNESVSFPVALDAGYSARKTYTDQITYEVTLSAGQTTAAVFPASIAAGISVNASFIGTPAYAERISCGVALGMSPSSAQTHMSAVAFPVQLFMQATDLSAIESENSFVVHRIAESFLVTES